VLVRFLLGPAGSGKTFRCLAEMRAALARSPDGPPLIFIAPKQATFQIERQLLDGETISGFTRLHVLSFDRLAQFVFENLHVAPPRLLSAEGRLMVLRALLRRHDGELKLLRGSARRVGFAQEVAGQLAELQQHQFSPARLRALVANENLRRDLRDKLHDLALLQEKYSDWLKRHDLQDVNYLLDFAVAALHSHLNTRKAHSSFVIQNLWLDGFAEMTPQEHALLAALMPYCQNATVAFCLETEPTPPVSWLSIWSAIGNTFLRCRERLTVLPEVKVETEILRRAPKKNRFAKDSALAALEEGWALPVTNEFEAGNTKSQISITACANPEAEAVFAARELLKFVRAGNRFRDCAVLVRNLKNYHQPLAQVFRRYGIPFFLDRRESVAHHPLAELTRSALRTVANDWKSEDWFAALKAGFTPLPDTDIDRLENMALEFGWRGKKWLEPLPDESCERLRQRILPPFEGFYAQLKGHKLAPTGVQLANAIRELWDDLGVESQLEQWSSPETATTLSMTRHSSIHETVFDQMMAWLENVAMAFPREPMPVRDWLPVLEAGLAGLTVGVIPPALDEVLVGAIDRARNPDLKFALLLGMNESVFPAAPAAPVILTNSDRDDLDKQNATLGLDVLNQISRERYLGYIACTRASQKLDLIFSRQDANGRALNPSPFIAHLEKTFPQLEIDEFSVEADWGEAEHVTELVQPVVEFQKGQSLLTSAATGSEWDSLMKLPVVKSLAEKLAQLREPNGQENLSPALAAKIYGPVLKSSVSRLEEFAQCPFRFFVHSGLRAEERKQFELDARERGTFQHEILKKFHDELTAENKRWRDVTPAEARERIGQIAAAFAPDYREGLMRMDDQSQFTARALTVALQDFVETLVAWMRGQYEFDPAKAETGFGLDEPGVPAWKIDLGNGHALSLRGRVDRVDLCRDGDRSLAVVMDYKSSARKLDKLLVENGIQLQLLAYLAAVRRWPPEFFGVEKIVPAGVFYVNLRGQFEGGGSRAEVLADAESARRHAYRHSGRFDFAVLNKLDSRHMGDQFSYRLNKDGSLRSNSAEAVSCKEFTTLLDEVEEQLRALGRRIFGGAAGVDPYRKGTTTACDYCDYRAVCRIDEWTHEFRDLRAMSEKQDDDQI
jgi:ATP-dependent helicase/nuclease subunit B